MTISENVPLSSLTTFRIGGTARYVISECAADEVSAAHSFADRVSLPLIPLGQGSNVLASDEPLEAVILQMRDQGFEVYSQADEPEKTNFVHINISAGMSWDTLVSRMSDAGWWGIENLAGIPGTVGASPVQNIGAYGAEVSSTIEYVDAYDLRTRVSRHIMANECAFTYRDSLFKQEPYYIITNVGFVFSRTATPNIEYSDLTAYIAAHAAEGITLDTPKSIATAVRAIRSRKFPDLTKWGTAGSFFKNPTVTQEEYDTLHTKYPALPGFIQPSGIKIPLAWILDHILHFNGYTKGNVCLFESQPLVLVADQGATTYEVELLASDVIKKVFDATGIKIECEVIFLRDRIQK